MILSTKIILSIASGLLIGFIISLYLDDIDSSNDPVHWVYRIGVFFLVFGLYVAIYNYQHNKIRLLSILSIIFSFSGLAMRLIDQF